MEVEVHRRSTATTNASGSRNSAAYRHGSKDRSRSGSRRMSKATSDWMEKRSRRSSVSLSESLSAVLGDEEVPEMVRQHAALFAETKAIELTLKNPEMICLEMDSSVEDALLKMKELNTFWMPIRAEELVPMFPDPFEGCITVLDILAYVTYKCMENGEELSESDQLKLIRESRNSLKSKCVVDLIGLGMDLMGLGWDRGIYTVFKDATVADLTEACIGGVETSIVYLHEDNEDEKQRFTIENYQRLSHVDILQFVFTNINPRNEICTLRLDQSGIYSLKDDEFFTVLKTDSILKALRLLLASEPQGVAIVGEDGLFESALSLPDCVQLLTNLEVLSMTVEQALMTVNDSVLPSPLTVDPKTTIFETMEALLQNKAHEIWVLDSLTERPIACIPLQDILVKFTDLDYFARFSSACRISITDEPLELVVEEE